MICGLVVRSDPADHNVRTVGVGHRGWDGVPDVVSFGDAVVNGNVAAAVADQNGEMGGAVADATVNGIGDV